MSGTGAGEAVPVGRPGIGVPFPPGDAPRRLWATLAWTSIAPATFDDHESLTASRVGVFAGPPVNQSWIVEPTFCGPLLMMFSATPTPGMCCEIQSSV